MRQNCQVDLITSQAQVTSGSTPQLSKVGVNRTQTGVSPKADSGAALRVGSRAVPGLGQKLLNRMELSDRSPGCVPTPQGDGAMNPPDEFLKHAADCEQMAKFARDPQGKATWKRMAERWRRCAEKFTSESLAAHQAMAAKRRQGVAPDWAHH
jgi:hypothetical protein